MPQAKERSIITDKLVVEKTGKTIEEWFAALDGMHAQTFTPAQIYDLVAKIPGLKSLGEWNQNLLATSYGWSRGVRERGQKEGGFEISVSKTMAVPLPVLYKTFMDDAPRSKWLGKEKITVRKATENKSARITWSDGETSLSVDFYIKGESKSQVVVQHQKIKDAATAGKLKEFWAEKLNALKLLLEK